MNEQLEFLKQRMKEKKIKELEDEAERLKEEIEKNKYGATLKDISNYFSKEKKK